MLGEHRMQMRLNKDRVYGDGYIPPGKGSFLSGTRVGVSIVQWECGCAVCGDPWICGGGGWKVAGWCMLGGL